MQVLIVAALVAMAAASGYGSVGPALGYAGVGRGLGYGGGHAAGYGGDYSEPRAYRFDYAVNDPHYGPQFAQSESNDGVSAQGYYSVALPDGRTQHVRYHADQAGYGGYNAEVTYTGGYGAHAAPAPSYH